VVDGRWVVGAVRDVAGFFGVSVETIAKWRQKGMPGKPGKFPLDKIAQWVRETIYPRQGAGQNGELSKAAAEHRKLMAEARTKELKLALLRGRLVERSAVMAENEQMFAKIKARLEAIPEEVGTSLPPALQQDIVADWQYKLNLILREIAGWSEGGL
jgi:phage terminase Nu1 subunit (DNA packaging protein)